MPGKYVGEIFTLERFRHDRRRTLGDVGIGQARRRHVAADATDTDLGHWKNPRALRAIGRFTGWLAGRPSRVLMTLG